MLLTKLRLTRLTLEYTKGEVALMVVSSVLLIILNYFMITGLKPQKTAGKQVEHIRMSR